MKDVTVITVNFNDAAGLDQTIRSVLKQTGVAVEYIVIDGGSTDTSKAVLQGYDNQIDYWESEKDSGTYDAMNKAIAKATGSYLIFLNSGDYFINAASLTNLFAEACDNDIVYGDIIYRSGKGDETFIFPDELYFDFFLDNSLPHPCTLIRRSLFARYGNYKKEIRICADWAFFLDAIADGCRYKHVHHVITIFFTGGLSSSFDKVREEKNQYLNEHYEFFKPAYVELPQLRTRMFQLKHSRVIRLVMKFLPSKFQQYIYG